MYTTINHQIMQYHEKTANEIPNHPMNKKKYIVNYEIHDKYRKNHLT